MRFSKIRFSTRFMALAAIGLAGLLAACGAGNVPGAAPPVYTDSVTGHFGAGMHAGRVSGQ